MDTHTHQVVDGYLWEYKIPEGVKICSTTWNEFFSEFVERSRSIIYIVELK